MELVRVTQQNASKYIGINNNYGKIEHHDLLQIVFVLIE
jgi:hypothetical protein